MTGKRIHRDLGTLDGPVLVFGGPYSNLQATEALIAQAKKRAIPSNQMICTGDVVAYCADGAATVTAIRTLGCPVVAGNCEKQLAAGAQGCGCGFEAGSTCDVLSAGWYGHADQTIDADDRAWMGGCPDTVTFRHAGRRCAVVHGGISDISRFLWPVSPEAEFQQEIDAITQAVGPVDIVLSGHCGVPFARQIADTLWINAGAIGLPPHDGRAATRYVVLEQGRPMIHRLTYDQRAAAQAMTMAGLVQGYHQTLSTGIWPSEDVLPAEMKNNGGRNL